MACFRLHDPRPRRRVGSGYDIGGSARSHPLGHLVAEQDGREAGACRVGVHSLD